MTLHRLMDETFNGLVLGNTKPVLVTFTSDWCGPCKELESTLEKLAEDKKDKAEFVLADMDKCSFASSQYGIRSLPTVMVFRDGKEVSRIEGVQTREKLLEMLGV
ncbi:thioredoxin family protein [Bacillus sp. FSL R9-9481]|uniref:thioredoxin family protein n=1 Tax=Bacillus sp. FSL R9-9481 TaxID=2921591 RepID=UPI0030FCF42D